MACLSKRRMSLRGYAEGPKRVMEIMTPSQGTIDKGADES